MMRAMSELFSDLISFFLISLSLGTAAFTWIADPKLTGAGFIRLITGHGLIFFAMFVGFAVALHGLQPFAYVAFVPTLLCLGLQWRFHPDGKTPVMWLLYVLQLGLTLLIFNVMAVKGETAAWGDYLFLLSSGLFLGLTHYSMLLGHYYLVVPKLTEKPLLVCLRLFWAFFAAKCLASAWGTSAAADFLTEGTTLGDGYTFNWLVISMRWLWGYAALAILSVFAWKLCRMRSIQSATGVLYIMVFFVFIGELLSTYLYFKYGLHI